MKTLEKLRAAFRGPLGAFLVIALASIALCLITGWIDFVAAGHSIKERIVHSIASGSLGGLPEVIVGVLGISITVVAIIVELASNRYTAKITELFMTSMTNISTLAFFVITAVMCVWLTITTGVDGFVPATTTWVVLIFVALCLLFLLPYFAFVFNFLNPHNIVERMAAAVLQSISRVSNGRAENTAVKNQVVRGIEQLADVASGAIESKDKVVCMHSVDALKLLCTTYLQKKQTMGTEWFRLSRNVRENPDFVSMQNRVLNDIEVGRYWLEMKILRQYQMLYGESLNRMRDINYQLAISTRKIAEEAMALDDKPIVALCVKFFNTYLRATVNAKDVRTAYNVLNQYRLLAQAALKKGDGATVLEIANRFKYYGQIGFSTGIPFVLETAAYDLCDLNERAFELNAPCQKELLAIFLDVDKEAEEGHSLEASLRGVRKAQTKLATYYLVRGAEKLARVIFEDMKDEIPSRLSSIREEFDGIRSRDFWEINDRGENFDYLDDDRRAMLNVYFEWFDKK